VVDDRGAIVQWAGVIADIHDRKRHAEEAAFINEVTEVLGLSLDYEETMRSVARLCVPAIADWCSIDIAREGEPYERLVIEHTDPEKARIVAELDRTYRMAAEVDPIVEVLRTGVAQVVEHVPDDVLVAAAHDEQHLSFIRDVGIRSWILAPMVARGRTLGVISVVTAESGRRFTNDDLPLIEEIARRAATAIDNARLYREAEEANRAKDEFLATLSHELRTPLTAIVGWAGMLRMGGLDAATQKVAVDTILRSAQSQRELIDDLLDVSRVVAGKMELALEDVDLVRVAQEVVVSSRPAAEAKKLAVELTCSEPRLVLRGDERRLRQIVWNLVSNAVKFTPAGGEIAVRVERHGDMARLSVRDTGRGIARSFLPHVWERFRQADSGTSRQFGGLGLGLAVARHFVELHGGTVAVASDGEGKGATFTIELPLPATKRAARSAAATGGDGAASLQGCRLVVVDDEPDARLVISAMLRQFGAEVVVASSSEEGLLAISARAPDAILTDIAMPGEDGYGLLRRVRGMAAVKHVPVIAVSAIGGMDDRARLLAAGFADFVRKPVEPGELAKTVAKHL
jgi:signal transduction histidine kinase